MFGKKTYTLEIYMKSGNVIRLDGITGYDICNEGDQIVSIKLEWLKPERRLLIKTISLSQIEAVCVIGG